MSRADQMFDKFVDFHKSNPKVWELFKKYTWELIDAGHKQYSSRTVIDRIRWHIHVETTGGQFKISNSHSVYYSRLFHVSFPEHRGFFQTRKLITQDREEKPGGDSFNIRPAGDEDELNAKLHQLVYDSNPNPSLFSMMGLEVVKPQFGEADNC